MQLHRRGTRVSEAKQPVALQATIPIDTHEKVRLTVAREETDAFSYRFFVVRHLRPTGPLPTLPGSANQRTLARGGKGQWGFKKR